MAYGQDVAMHHLDQGPLTQLDPIRCQVSVNASRVRQSKATDYIPDLAVIPINLMGWYRQRRRDLDVYDEPIPPVVEIGGVHPSDRAATVWRSQDDGTYGEAVYHQGTIELVVLPGGRTNLDTLFDG